MVAPIDSAKPSVIRAPKMDAPVAPTKASPPPAPLPSAPTGSGFEAKREKKVSLGRTNLTPSFKPTADVRADSPGQLSGARLAQQGAGGVNFSAGVKQADSKAPSGPLASLAGMTDRLEIGDKIATMSPKEVKALDVAISSGQVKDPQVVYARLAQVDNKTAVAMMKGVSKEALDGMKELVRAGKLEGHDSLNVMVGIETAARTPWGQDKANAGAVKKLREAASATPPKITANLAEGLGDTTNGKIKLSAKLLQSPEEMAAILAHEGTHLAQASGTNSIKDEVEGNAAGAAVWKQLGKTTDAAQPEIAKQLNGYAAMGPKAMLDHVGEMYMEAAKDKLAARQAEAKDNPEAAKTRKPNDTVAAWEKQVADFTKELVALQKAVPSQVAITGATAGTGKGAVK
jgi:hypothetical protein